MARHTTLSTRGSEYKQYSRASVRARAQGTQPDVTQKIYLGKGQFIDDLPSKYPTKDEWSGGWAGGEVGLLQFVAQAQLEEAVQKEAGENPPPQPGALGTGTDTIYVGKGQYIKDDDRMYPSKEDVGPLRGSAGGFAGGERGLQHFIRTQSLVPAPQEEIKQRQTTKDAFAVAGTAAVAGASYVAYLFLTGQSLPDVPDVASLTTTASQMTQTVSGAATESISVGVPPVPGAVPSFSAPSISAPAVSGWQIKVAAAMIAAVVAVVGGKIAIQKTKEVVVDTTDNVKLFVEDNLTRMLVLGAACAVYYFLLY